MKKLILTLVFIATGFVASAQVGIGTTDPDGILDVVSTDSGVILPRVASTAAVTAPIDGMMIYDVSTSCIKAYEGGVWSACFSAGAPTPSFRVATNNTITDSDVGNYVIYEGPGGAIDIDGLTLTEGAIIRIIDNGPNFEFESSLGNFATNANSGQSIQGTTFSIICDGTRWLNFGN
jgi:hypothetical protein